MELSPFLAAVVLLAGGAVACFFGHRLFRFGLALLGFVIGALVAAAFFGDGTAPLAWFTGAVHGLFGTGTAAGLLIAAFRALYSLAVALLGGLVGAAILGWAYYLGVALLGAVLGAIVAHVVLAARGLEPAVLLIVLFSIAGAVLAMYLERYVIIVGTAFGGAWTMIVGALALGGNAAAAAVAGSGRFWLTYPFEPAEWGWWGRVVWIVLGCSGVAAQLGWTAGNRGRVGRRKRNKGQ